MNISDTPIYIKQLDYLTSVTNKWKLFDKKTFLITGASGMIGSFLIDIFMHLNSKFGSDIKIIAVGRNKERANKLFAPYINNKHFWFLTHDVNKPFDCNIRCDYIIHAASNTHPVAYASDPIGTITANIIGTNNVLQLAAQQNNCRTAFLSSVEVYGQNREDTDKFSEDYCGYIDCNTMRAGYPESKRAGEALCQAYISAHNLDVVIPRLSRVYGPTMLDTDTKAVAQFIKKAVNHEDIVMKSDGSQLYSYAYIADAVTAILHILLYGKSGEAYNVCSDYSDVTLKELAHTLAELSSTSIVFDIPDSTELQGYSKATKALLNCDKIHDLGWISLYNIYNGLRSTLEILSACHFEQ